MRDERYPFKRINEDADNGLMEDDWYEPRGIDSLKYRYSKTDAQYIFQKHIEKRTVVEKEVFGFTGDSD